MNQPTISGQTGTTPIHNFLQVELPEFDLTIIMERVAQDHSDWSQERLAAAELEYLRYFTLCKQEPNTALIPTLDADEVWHTHILHTQQYRKDCNRYFGYFLDHAPFNRQNEKFSVGYTAELYLRTFGISYDTTNIAECTNCNCTGGDESTDVRVKRIQ